MPSSDAGGASIRLRVWPGPQMQPVLARVLGTLAARSELSIDRVSDALLVADALAAHAPAMIGGQPLDLEITAEVGGLRLLAGPLPEGGAARLLAADRLPGSLGGVIERVANPSVVALPGGGERLAVEIREPAGLGAVPAR